MVSSLDRTKGPRRCRWQYAFLLLFVLVLSLLNSVSIANDLGPWYQSSIGRAILGDLERSHDPPTGKDGPDEEEDDDDDDDLSSMDMNMTNRSINFIQRSYYKAIDDSRWADSNFPPQLKVCNISHLKFNQSKVYRPSSPIALHHKDGTIDAVYGPLLTKCGTTTVKKLLNTVANDTMYYLNYPKDVNDKIVQRNIFFTFLRHPLDRILAGYHQVERLLRSYPDRYVPWVKRNKISWWNSSCIDTTYGEKLGNGPTRLVCTATEPASDFQARFARLDAFLDDQLRVGFFDQHTTPMASLISSSEVFKRANTILYFNLDHIEEFSKAFSKRYNRPMYNTEAKLMSRNIGAVHQYKWIVTWDEVMEKRGTEPLAQEVLRKLCLLYRHDVECFPYRVPECDPFY